MTGNHVLFDIVAWLSALAIAWFMYRWRFRERIDELTERINAGYFFALSGGGLAGAYGFGIWNAWLSSQAGIGRTLLGGIVGAILFVELYKLAHGIRAATGAILAVPLAVAIAVGRMGCLSAGLDDFTYGTPTTVAWAVDFGDGVPRHPVPVYESIAMALTAAVLLGGFARGSSWLMQNAFYVAVGIYGLQRFAWEFFKPYATIIGPLNLFHVLCILLVTYAAFMIYGGNRERT